MSQPRGDLESVADYTRRILEEAVGDLGTLAAHRLAGAVEEVVAEVALLELNVDHLPPAHLDHGALPEDVRERIEAAHEDACEHLRVAAQVAAGLPHDARGALRPPLREARRGVGALAGIVALASAREALRDQAREVA